VAEIATASKEQSQGISQVNIAVTQMDKVTQSNASSAEETASAAEELNAQTEEIRQAVLEIQQLVQGGNGNPTTVSTPTRSQAAAHSVVHSQPRQLIQSKGTFVKKNSIALPSNRKTTASSSIPMDDDFQDMDANLTPEAARKCVRGLALGCPKGNRETSCPMNQISSNPSDRLEAISKMSDSKVKQIYEAHVHCMSHKN